MGAAATLPLQQAIAQAVADGAKVINMSLGGPEYSQSMNDAVQDAWNAGLVIVAGAGNDGTTALFYPAAFNNVISVGGVRRGPSARVVFQLRKLGRHLGSRQRHHVGVSDGRVRPQPAPGDTGCYTWLSGTSMATPHVVGCRGARLVAKPT